MMKTSTKFETTCSVLAVADASKLSGRYETEVVDKQVPVLRSLRNVATPGKMILRGSLTPRGQKAGRSFDVDDLCQAFQRKANVTPNFRNPKKQSPSNKAPLSVDSVKEDLRLALGSKNRCVSKKAAPVKGKTSKVEDGKKTPAASSVVRVTRSSSRGRLCV
ncbi:hypothetical protein THAOC_02037 [Thalassiosira oceanica]|uniref:Uncharacterized protein n=1 Tax=Thalassiosira oceanica TaxID=159749 RepID=K0TGV4_THAOC|nr:hypothetical protein THAOC_02037 [Thalassiosira oceanica]|eukprot:EJK76214.1 hypothetical protein THAOC_02037 [Thalassiosira oceanica]